MHGANSGLIPQISHLFLSSKKNPISWDQMHIEALVGKEPDGAGLTCSRQPLPTEWTGRQRETQWRKFPRRAGQCLRPAHLPQPRASLLIWTIPEALSDLPAQERCMCFLSILCTLRCYFKKQAKDSKLGLYGLPWWFCGKEFACQCRRRKRQAFDCWKKIPWRRAWQPFSKGSILACRIPWTEEPGGPWG